MTKFIVFFLKRNKSYIKALVILLLYIHTVLTQKLSQWLEIINEYHFLLSDSIYDHIFKNEVLSVLSKVHFTDCHHKYSFLSFLVQPDNGHNCATLSLWGLAWIVGVKHSSRVLWHMLNAVSCSCEQKCEILKNIVG